MNFFPRAHGAPTQRTRRQSKSPRLSLRDLCVRAPARLCVKIAVLSILATALLPACRREARNENPDTPASSGLSSTAVPGPSTTSTSDHAEVFRRAFWRQPGSADRILQAERRVDPADGSWCWFIQLHPGPELLSALRTPDTFGLLPAGALRPGSIPGHKPDWFPAAPASADFELLQSPSTGLTVFYRASDDLLFATDTGQDFAPPARPLATR